MKVFCCQLNIAWENKAANFARVRQLLAAAKLESGSLVLLPEMFATGFSMNVAGIAEVPDGPTEAFLGKLAADMGIFVQGGVVTRDATGKGRNEALVCGPDGKLVTRYCKLHPFSYGGETKHYASGERAVSYDLGATRVCPFVCYDLRFPEVFRLGVRHGAKVFAIIACWPAARELHWTTLLRARAIENQAYVVGCNRVGADPKVTYSGHSMIIGPRGEILADAGGDEGVIGVEIDLAALERYRAEFPALKDMRQW